jgi:TRAP-type C4-dicarboxylate transport system permease small subunit
MSHGFELEPAESSDLPVKGALGALARMVGRINGAILVISMLALLAAAFILTYSVFSRYLFKAATDWQDEAAVFCLVGATFLCGAAVQARRGHIGIEAIAGLLPHAVNRARMFLVDVLSMLFCTFFAWKSWALCHEAWVEKQTTSSSWAPPLALPYALMALGVTLLAVQIALQIAARLWPESAQTMTDSVPTATDTDATKTGAVRP